MYQIIYWITFIDIFIDYMVFKTDSVRRPTSSLYSILKLVRVLIYIIRPFVQYNIFVISIQKCFLHWVEKKERSINKKKVHYFDKLEKFSQREAAFIMNNSPIYIKPNFKNRKQIDENGNKICLSGSPKNRNGKLHMI